LPSISGRGNRTGSGSLFDPQIKEIETHECHDESFGSGRHRSRVERLRSGWGESAQAVVGTGAAGERNFLNMSLAGGRNTSAFTAGLGNSAADIGNNTDHPAPVLTKPLFAHAFATGSLNRVLNVGGDNRGIAMNTPTLSGPINIGGNSVTNIGRGNNGQVLGPPLSQNNSSLSNVLNIGDDNVSTASIGQRQGCIRRGQVGIGGWASTEKTAHPNGTSLTA